MEVETVMPMFKPIIVHTVMTSASDYKPNIRGRVDLVLEPSLFFRCTVDDLEIRSHDTNFRKAKQFFSKGPEHDNMIKKITVFQQRDITR